jgi:Tol biopolymer transport system component
MRGRARSRGSRWIALALVLGAGAYPTAALAQTAPSTRQVSVNAFPVPRALDVDAACFSSRGSISGDGRWVAYYSSATNLVSGDSNGASDVFLRDLVAFTQTRVSLTQSGGQGNNLSVAPDVSATGRFIAFYSNASNLVPADTNGKTDVFVRDLGFGGTVVRASVPQGGGQANASSFTPAISADGRFVAFHSAATNLVTGDTNGVGDIFVRDLVAGTTELASVSSTGQVANGASSGAAISADGRYVAFLSVASNLVGDDTNGLQDIFVRDRVAHTTERVSVPAAGGQANDNSFALDMSGDGRYVAFDSSATNLVSGDGNGAMDVFVRDRVGGTTARVSVSTGGAEGNGGSRDPAFSADGRAVAFVTDATNIGLLSDRHTGADIYLHDLATGDTQIVSLQTDGTAFVGNTPFGDPSISADARFVVFDGLGLSSPQSFREVWRRDRAIDPGVRLSVSEASATEGSPGSPGTMLFTVILSARTTQLVTFRYWTEDVQARSGSDYVRTVGTGSILPGQIATTIAVPAAANNTCELAEAMHLNIDVPNGATIADGQGIGTITDDDCTLVFTIGTFELSPEDAVARAGADLVTYALSWTVPTESWRDLDSLELRIGEDGEVLWLRFDETTRTFALVNPRNGHIGPGFAAGSRKVLSSRRASLHLADTRIVTAGPDSPEVTLLLPVSFKPSAAGAVYPVAVQATNDEGDATDFVPATSVTVVPRHSHRPR